MPVSPSTDNYFIGKGTVSFHKTGDTAARDIGNVPELEFTPSIEKLDHFSSRSGVRKKDKTVIIEKGGALRVVMDEITAENLALAVAGDVSTNTAGNQVVDILAQNAVDGVLTFTGTNEVGDKLNATFLNVSFTPEGSINFISDEWGQIEVTAEVLADGSGNFGTIEVVPQV